MEENWSDEVDKVVEYPKPPKPTKEERREARKEWNNNPRVIESDTKAVSRSFYHAFIWISVCSLIILIVALLISNFFWFNHIFSKKDFSPKVSNEITVETPNVSVEINHTIINDIQINNTIIMPEEITIKQNST